MNEVIRFALLGLGVGALYALASQGLIVIYRGTGVLNFSLGATAIAPIEEVECCLSNIGAQLAPPKKPRAASCSTRVGR